MYCSCYHDIWQHITKGYWASHWPQDNVRELLYIYIHTIHQHRIQMSSSGEKFVLSYGGRDRMDDNWQMPYSHSYLCMKIVFLFSFKAHRNLFPIDQLTVRHHWFRQWLGTDQGHAIILTKYGKVYWFIYVYATLGQEGFMSNWQILTLTFHIIRGEIKRFALIRDAVFVSIWRWKVIKMLIEMRYVNVKNLNYRGKEYSVNFQMMAAIRNIYVGQPWPWISIISETFTKYKYG